MDWHNIQYIVIMWSINKTKNKKYYTERTVFFNQNETIHPRDFDRLMSCRLTFNTFLFNLNNCIAEVFLNRFLHLVDFFFLRNRLLTIAIIVNVCDSGICMILSASQKTYFAPRDHVVEQNKWICCLLIGTQ
jgi:hypothetical protein